MDAILSSLIYPSAIIQYHWWYMHKILMVISEAPPIMSGISKVGARLKSGLEALGHQIDVLSVQDIPRLAIGEVRLSSMLWRAPKLLLRRLDEYDIVHIHGPVPTFSDVALLFSALRPNSSTPVVYTHHSEIDLRSLRLICDIYNYTHKQFARLADQVLVSTPAYAERLRRYVPDEYVSVVPWGVDDGWYDSHQQKNEQFTVLFVGQLRPYKGLDTLLGAMGRLRGVELQIVGGGHEEQHYRSLVAERGLDNVIFRGKLGDTELFEAFSRSHVIALPSTTHAEAFGLVLLEGMLARCVPVVSQLPGVTDVVGDAGFSFPVGNEAALATILARLRDDAQLLDEYSERARVRARQFSWQRTIGWHSALYDRLISLKRFGSELRTAEGPDSALGTLLRDTVSTLGASTGSIMMIDHDTEQLYVRAIAGLPVEFKNNLPQRLGQGIAGLVALRNQPLLLPQGFSAFAGLGEGMYLQRDHIQSSLSVPIRTTERTLGVINLSSHDDGAQFDADALDWLDTLGQRAGHLLRSSR